VGDWMGTFYTHDDLPRVAKNTMTAIGRSGGADTVAGGSTTPQGNSPYYDYKTGNTVSTDTPSTSGDTPPSNTAAILQTITRAVLP